MAGGSPADPDFVAKRALQAVIESIVYILIKHAKEQRANTMASNDTTAILVEPDSNGNIMITIKLVIAAPAAGAPVSNAPTIIADQVNESQRSVNLLESDSDSESTLVPLVAPGVENAAQTANSRYSLRSRVNVEDNISNEESNDFEVDYELSQQVSSFLLQD